MLISTSWSTSTRSKMPSKKQTKVCFAFSKESSHQIRELSLVTPNYTTVMTSTISDRHKPSISWSRQQLLLRSSAKFRRRPSHWSTWQCRFLSSWDVTSIRDLMMQLSTCWLAKISSIRQHHGPCLRPRIKTPLSSIKQSKNYSTRSLQQANWIQ